MGRAHRGTLGVYRRWQRGGRAPASRAAGVAIRVLPQLDARHVERRLDLRPEAQSRVAGDDRQTSETAVHGIAVPRGLRIEQREIRPAPQQPAEDGLCLDRRERSTNANGPEPNDSEPPWRRVMSSTVGLLVTRRIAVGRADQRHDQIGAPHTDGHAASRRWPHVARCTARGCRSAATRAPRRAAGPVRVCSRSHCCAMRKQRVQPVAQQVARRLVSGKQQHRALGEQLRAGAYVARGLGLQQVAHHVVGRRAPPLWQQRLEVPAHGQQARLRAPRLLAATAAPPR